MAEYESLFNIHWHTMTVQACWECNVFVHLYLFPRICVIWITKCASGSMIGQAHVSLDRGDIPARPRDLGRLSTNGQTILPVRHEFYSATPVGIGPPVVVPGDKTCFDSVKMPRRCSNLSAVRPHEISVWGISLSLPFSSFIFLSYTRRQRERRIYTWNTR